MVVGRFKQGIDRDWDGSDLDRPEEAEGELGAVEQEQEDAFLNSHPELPQRVSEAVYPFPELAVSDADVSRLDGNFFFPAFVKMSIDEVGGGIEWVGEQNGRTRNHLEVARLRKLRRMITPLTPKLATAPKARASVTCGVT